MSYCYSIQNMDKRYLFSLFQTVRKIFLFITCRLIRRIKDQSKNSLSSYFIYVCIINKMICLCPLVGYRLEHSKIKFVSTSGLVISSLYLNDIQESSDELSFYLFADDTHILCADKNLTHGLKQRKQVPFIHILCADKNLTSFELSVNLDQSKLCDWLTANKLTLNIKKKQREKKKRKIKKNIVFCAAQRKLTYQPKLVIFDNEPKKECNSGA